MGGVCRVRRGHGGGRGRCRGGEEGEVAVGEEGGSLTSSMASDAKLKIFVRRGHLKSQV